MAVNEQLGSGQDEFLHELVGQENDLPFGFEPDDEYDDDGDSDFGEDGRALDVNPYGDLE
ncbi:hypothetical protein [Aeromonas sp. R7-2]|uniref:hypothetical protein n=1 Tax=Aeromonas sp. R7-2 TaxID=3138474 RepID=UPI0034A48532